MLLVWASTKVTTKAVLPCVGILVGYLVVNAVSAYSVSQNVKSVTVLAERIPLYYPIRANTFLSKFGLVAVGEEKLSLSQKVGSFHYPLNELSLGKGTDLNVLILAIDSLRADVVDAKTMPNLTKLQNQALVFRSIILQVMQLVPAFSVCSTDSHRFIGRALCLRMCRLQR